MKINFDLYYKQSFLPTTRFKNPHTRFIKTTATVNLREISEGDFPVALKVHSSKSIFTGKYTLPDKTEYKTFVEDIRTDGKRLYRPSRDTYGAAICQDLPLWTEERKEMFVAEITRSNHYKNKWLYKSASNGTDYNPEKSIVLSDTKKHELRKIREIAKRYLIYNAMLWEETPEPMYVVQTFGLGHNHGGTALFVEENGYNPNLGAENYFNALDRNSALEHFKNTAARRGDTFSLDNDYSDTYIEVILPNMVKSNPSKEHGKGDPFLNKLKAITESSPDTITAGLMTIMVAHAEINKKGM